MSGAVGSSSADEAALREAARWFARLESDAVSADQQAAWAAWCAADAAHARAWARIEAVRQQFARAPARVTAPALLGARQSRRALLRGFGLLALGGVAGAAAYRELPWPAWSADLRTATGERRTLQLDDGSRLQLDTASAVDLRFDAEQRRLQLHAGAILVSAAHDAAGRPFVVETPQGRLRALGTRFAVRLEAGSQTVLTVLEHAVEVRPARAPGAARIVAAGAQLRFSAGAFGETTIAMPAASSWADGSLVAVDMPLAQLAAELGRYRPGHLGCDPAIAGLSVSGAFPLDDTERALATLQRSFPVRVRRRSDWWLTLVPAESA